MKTTEKPGMPDTLSAGERHSFQLNRTTGAFDVRQGFVQRQGNPRDALLTHGPISFGEMLICCPSAIGRIAAQGRSREWTGKRVALPGAEKTLDNSGIRQLTGEIPPNFQYILKGSDAGNEGILACKG